jgi:hypothetical protein
MKLTVISPSSHFYMMLNPLTAKGEREREREEKVGGVAIGTTFNGKGGWNINLVLRLRRSPGSARSSFW